METYNLTKADWNKLNKLDLVNEGVGNGFANTTEKFDDNINCNSHVPTYIKINGMQYTYIVQYIDGCFYPIWYKAYTNKFDYIINKKGEIIIN